ncbi:terminase [Diaphorobacter sp. MNS-0]|uniref:terminase n=1 Tax=Diaphorobacter sp. MNS-0 TaxID=2866628 RepID=UPI001C731DFD|nr:terminase [Diaphorobacter sp. MNS-0]QYY23969.1 terminase [Diaphorobacter sp. MNS-0]
MKLTPKRKRSDSAAAAVQAHQNAAQGPIEPPPYITLPAACRPFWDAIVTARPRDTWNDADLANAANLARVQHAIESAVIGSDEHAKLTRLSMALARAVAVHPTATVGRAADLVNAATAEREARQDDGDELIPRLRAV